MTVIPVMDYCSEVWGAGKYDFNDRAQYRAMRTILGVRKCTPIPAMYGDLQWLTPLTRHRVAMVRYWCRLTRMPSARLTKRVFEWDYQLGSRGRRTWNKDVHTILTQCGLAEAFDRDHWHRNSVDMLVNHVTQQLTGRDQSQRSAEAATMSRMRLYRQLEAGRRNQDDTAPSNYLKFNRHQRSAIAKIRMGTLPLHIETGRYVSRPVEQRLCRNCELGAIENELHFIFHCPKYNDIRDIYIGPNADNSDIDNLFDIFSNYNRTRQLANYITKAMLLRLR